MNKYLFLLLASLAFAQATTSSNFDKTLAKVQAASGDVVTYSVKKNGSKRLSTSFKVSQFAAKKTDKVLISKRLVELLQRVRDFYTTGLTFVSAYRAPGTKSSTGCTENSIHSQGIAVDFKITGIKPAAIADFLESICSTCGIGLYSSYVHLDTRGTKKLWKNSPQNTVKTFWSGVKVTGAQLTKMFPKVKGTTATKYAEYINEAIRMASVNTKRRLAHFLGQVGHESGGLTTFSEWYKGKNPQAYFNNKYGSRKDLGNTVKTDGYKYRGRGPIQVTGKANYKLCGKALGVDLVSQPDLLLNTKYGFRAAGWFWAMRKINTYADADNLTMVTKRVNGGTNGISDRKQRTALAKKVLGA